MNRWCAGAVALCCLLLAACASPPPPPPDTRAAANMALACAPQAKGLEGLNAAVSGTLLHRISFWLCWVPTVRMTRGLLTGVLHRSRRMRSGLAVWSAFGTCASHLPALSRRPQKSARSCFPAKPVWAGLDKFLRVRHADWLWLAACVLPFPAGLVP